MFHDPPLHCQHFFLFIRIRYELFKGARSKGLTLKHLSPTSYVAQVDKDGVSAAVVMAGLVNQLASEGSTLLDCLNSVYDIYGKTME